jgi:hypothetical protein
MLEWNLPPKSIQIREQAHKNLLAKVFHRHLPGPVSAGNPRHKRIQPLDQKPCGFLVMPADTVEPSPGDWLIRVHLLCFHRCA